MRNSDILFHPVADYCAEVRIHLYLRVIFIGLIIPRDFCIRPTLHFELTESAIHIGVYGKDREEKGTA